MKSSARNAQSQLTACLTNTSSAMLGAAPAGWGSSPPLQPQLRGSWLGSLFQKADEMMSEIVQVQNCLPAIFTYFTKFCQVLQWIFKLVPELTRRTRDALYTKCGILTKGAHDLENTLVFYLKRVLFLFTS